MKLKKLISGISALALALTTFGVSALADSIETQDDFASALNNAKDGDTITLSAGDFILDDGTMTIASVNTLNFVGAGSDTVITLGNSKGDGNGGIGSCIGANMTFTDLSLTSLVDTTYTGFTQAAGLTFNNVTFNYGFSNWGNKGGDVNFYNCTFNIDENAYNKKNDIYNVNELRSDNGTSYIFDTCTFNSYNGRFINAYKQGGSTSKITVTIKDCTFNGTSTILNKSAVNMKTVSSNEGCTIDLYLLGTNTTNNVNVNSSTGSALFMDNGVNGTVYQGATKEDAKIIWKAGASVSSIASVGTDTYESTQAALEAAKTAETTENVVVNQSSTITNAKDYVGTKVSLDKNIALVTDNSLLKKESSTSSTGTYEIVATTKTLQADDVFVQYTDKSKYDQLEVKSVSSLDTTSTTYIKSVITGAVNGTYYTELTDVNLPQLDVNAIVSVIVNGIPTGTTVTTSLTNTKE